MVWDFAEVNPFSSSTGSYESAINNITKAFDNLPTNYINGESYQLSAQTQSLSNNKVISTDPPYYDNIAYADLSDFFYVWLRHNLKPIYPSIFTTLATPKTEELVATAYRHNGKENAEHFFLNRFALSDCAGWFSISVFLFITNPDKSINGTQSL